MMQGIPNSGIMGDDGLDKFRQLALEVIIHRRLPDPVAEYIEALERRYIDLKHQEQLRSLREIGWSASSQIGGDG